MDELSRIQFMLESIGFESGEADYATMYSVVESIRQLESSRKAVPLMLRWFETHWESDVSSPGPFVHFIEEFPDYVQHLENPCAMELTRQTVLMVNRIVNIERDLNGVAYWVSLMQEAAGHPLADISCKELAQEFVAYQASI
ncbi:MAG: hypothetical protein R3F08_12310 [Dokdonella sp.]